MGGQPARPRRAAYLTLVEVVVDAATGLVQYAWQAGDLDDIGEFSIVWTLTYPGGRATAPTEDALTLRVVDNQV